MAETIGNKVAPARFIAFMALLVAAGAAGMIAVHQILHDPLREAVAKGFMLGFDLAALVFIAACLPLLRIDDPATMRAHAAANDANRTILLVITAVVSIAILAAVASETMGGESPGLKTKALIVGTLLIAWLFANTIYALHYAHL
jgi:uncharacterized membrane protein